MLGRLVWSLLTIHVEPARITVALTLGFNGKVSPAYRLHADALSPLFLQAADKFKKKVRKLVPTPACLRTYCRYSYLRSVAG